MYLCSFVLFCLGNVFFVTGAGMKMQQSQQKSAPILDIQMDIPKGVKFSRLLLPLWGHIEILEERDNFREIMKYQQNNLKKNIDWQVLWLQVRPASKIKKSTRQSLHSGQHKQLGRRTNPIVAKQAKLNNDALKTIYNESQTKRQIELQHNRSDETHFKINGGSKKHQKLVTLKLGEPELMMDREENEGYEEVKRKIPRLRSTELLTGYRRNRQPKGERKAEPRKVNGRKKIIGILSGSWKNRKYLEQTPKIDGKAMNQDVTSTNNRFTKAAFYITTRNLKSQYKGDKKDITKQVTPTTDEARTDIPLDPNTNRGLTFFQSIEDVMSKELNRTKKGSKETGFSLVTNTNIQIKCSEADTSMEVITAKSGSRKDELSLDTTTKRPLALSCRERVEVPTEASQTTKDTFSNTKIQLESQPEIDGTNSHRGDQTHLWNPSDNFLQAEGSGSYEQSQKWAHENKINLAPNTASSQYISRQTKHTSNLQLPLSTPKLSSDNAQPSPTRKMDTENSRASASALSEVLHNSLSRPQEATMNDSAKCKPGYKEYSGICRSLCDIGGIYCENGGQCVIVENMGAMCRCQQTNYLCYSGECCRTSLTLIQLTCIIGSCCILLSVFLGCLPALIRRMDVKAVSKSVRTRLWISSLMPDFGESSSSHSIESDFTISADCDCPPDLSTFHCTKEVIRDSALWKCESTRL